MEYLGNFTARFCFFQYIYSNSIFSDPPQKFLDFLETVFIFEQINKELFSSLITNFKLNKEKTKESLDEIITRPITDPLLWNCLLAGGSELFINPEKKLIISEYLKIGKEFYLPLGIINKILDLLSIKTSNDQQVKSIYNI